MKRKTIAVCVSGFLWESETRIINGIKEICRKRNTNVLVFDSQIRKSDVYTTEIDKYRYILRGESEIFNLINYKLIDGLILLSDTIFDKSVVQKICDNCTANNIPMVCANDLTADFKHNVFIDNQNSMELMVEHLVTKHHCTKINFIGGMVDNKETIERLNAYKKVLSKYDIPIDQDRIGYGFFYKAAVDVTKKFLKSGKEIEAIVCANDAMAIFVIEYLKKIGISVPDQMIVTGYDGTKEASEFAVKITTLTVDFEKLGIQCVKLIDQIEEKGIAEKSIGVKSKLVIQESCGCVKKVNFDSKDFIERKYASENAFSKFSSYLTQMNALCASDEDTDALFEDLMRPACLFKFKSVLLCICSELEKSKNYFYNDFKIVSRYGFSRKMLSVSCDFLRLYRNGTKQNSGIYQLMDFYTMFYHQFGKRKTSDSHYWSSLTETPTQNTWYGLAYERVCLYHFRQIIYALRLDAIHTEFYSWRSRESVPALLSGE